MNTRRHQFRLTRQVASPGSALTVISVSGELDLSDMEAFSSALEDALVGDAVLLEMESVAFMDSSALQVVLRAKQKLDAADVPAVLVASEESVVAKLFEMTGLTSSLPRAATIEEAKKLLE